MQTPTSLAPAEIPAEQQARARNTFRAALVLFAAVVATVLFYVYLGLQSDAWQILAVAGVGIVLGGLVLLSAGLSRRGRVTEGAGLLIGSMLVAIVVDSALIANLGVVLGLATLLTTVAIATQTLPQQWVNRAMLAGVVASVAAGLLDLLAPPFQLALPEIESFAPVIIVITLLVYAVLVARQYRSYSLPSKLIVAFLAVSLISIAAVALFTQGTVRASLGAEIGANLQSLARVEAVSIGDLLAKQVDQLFAFGTQFEAQAEAASAAEAGNVTAIQAEIDRLDRQWQRAVAAGDETDPLVQSRLGSDIASAMREYREAFPASGEVLLTDRYGALIAATNLVPGYAQADQAWWQAAYNNGVGATYIGQPEFDRNSALYVSTVAIPLFASDSRDVVGILGVKYHLSGLLDTLSGTRFGQTGGAELLLPNGKFLRLSGEAPAHPDFLAALREMTSTYAEIDFEGALSLVSQTPLVTVDPDEAPIISGLGWTVVVHQNRDESLALVEQQSRSAVLVAVVVAGVMAGAAIGVGQFLSAPIARLTRVAQSVAAGDLTVHAVVKSHDEIGTLATAMNSMTEQLRVLIGSLEERVAARTAQLQASAEVGRAVAAILDPDQLVRQAVDLITDRFGFYYVAVFTLDEAGRFAALRAATGEAGKVLEEHGHRLEVGGQSMVGSAIALRRPRIALDVGAEAVRFVNPLLPHTRSEIALPLVVGERIIGALDAQSTQAAAFDEANAAVLQSMVNQLAVALNNAEQFRRAERQARAQANLLAAAVELTGRLDRAALFDLIARRAVTVIGADGAGVWLAAGDEYAGVELVAAIHLGETYTLGQRLVKGEGLPGQVLATGEAVRVDDAGDPTSHGAALAVPMRFAWQQHTSGVLVAARSQPGSHFDADDERLARLFATQAAAALANAELLEEQGRTLEELDAINRQLTGEAWTKQFNRMPEGLLQAHFARGGQAAMEQAWLPEVELSVSSMKPVAWSERAEQIISSPFQAALAAPIVLRGEVIGALQVGEVSHARFWSSEDLAFVQGVADQVALAVENARLIEETQRAAQRDQIVAQAADRIRRPVDLEAVLRTAVEEIGRITGASDVSIRLGVAASSPDNGGSNGHTE